jgi:hypothetical protein
MFSTLSKSQRRAFGRPKPYFRLAQNQMIVGHCAQEEIWILDIIHPLGFARPDTDNSAKRGPSGDSRIAAGEFSLASSD